MSKGQAAYYHIRRQKRQVVKPLPKRDSVNHYQNNKTPRERCIRHHRLSMATIRIVILVPPPHMRDVLLLEDFPMCHDAAHLSITVLLINPLIWIQTYQW
jgi:hypothetical protein